MGAVAMGSYTYYWLPLLTLCLSKKIKCYLSRIPWCCLQLPWIPFYNDHRWFDACLSVLLFQVLEVRPVIDWDKGKAVMFLLESLGTSWLLFVASLISCIAICSWLFQLELYDEGFFFSLSGLSKHEDVLPIYIGDDRTDEDAFKVIYSYQLGIAADIGLYYCCESMVY